MVPEIGSATDSFSAFFCTFTPLTTQKTKIFKKWKKHLEILLFYTSVPKIMIMCYTVPEVWHVTDVIFIFQFGLFFALLTPLKPWKIKIKKKKKKLPWRHHHFTHVHHKLWSCMMYSSWDMVRDRQTDGWKKWHIEVGAPPKNGILLHM